MKKSGFAEVTGFSAVAILREVTSHPNHEFWPLDRDLPPLSADSRETCAGTASGPTDCFWRTNSQLQFGSASVCFGKLNGLSDCCASPVFNCGTSCASRSFQRATADFKSWHMAVKTSATSLAGGESD